LEYLENTLFYKNTEVNQNCANKYFKVFIFYEYYVFKLKYSPNCSFVYTKTHPALPCRSSPEQPEAPSLPTLETLPISHPRATAVAGPGSNGGVHLVEDGGQ
jgi:hypothetical protein